MTTMKNPTPLLELCEQATQGPECPECAVALKKFNNIDRRMAARGNFGIVPASPVCEKHFGADMAMRVARSQIHARLSPEVVRDIYLSLEHIAKLGETELRHVHKQFGVAPHRVTHIARDLMKKLDGQTPN